MTPFDQGLGVFDGVDLLPNILSMMGSFQTLNPKNGMLQGGAQKSWTTDESYIIRLVRENSLICICVCVDPQMCNENRSEISISRHFVAPTWAHANYRITVGLRSFLFIFFLNGMVEDHSCRFERLKILTVF